MIQPEEPTFDLTGSVLSVAGRFTSDKVHLLRQYLEAFELAHKGTLQLDFSYCTVFSTGGVPYLLDFIERAKSKKMNLSIKMGGALRKACTIASVIPAIKRLDPDA